MMKGRRERETLKLVELITPYLCRQSSKRVLRPVRRTPAHNGMWNNMLSANAVPITVSASEQYGNQG